MLPSGMGRWKLWEGTLKVISSPAFQKALANSCEKSKCVVAALLVEELEGGLGADPGDAQAAGVPAAELEAVAARAAHNDRE